jgi:hypothetical protein
MNRTHTLAVAGIALALLALAPAATAIRGELPPEVKAIILGLPDVPIPFAPPPPPGTPACVDTHHGVPIIVGNCVEYLIGPVAGWATEDMVLWAKEYESRADDYPGTLIAFTPQVDAYRGALAAYLVAYANAQAVEPALGYGGAALSYEAAVSAWGLATAAIVVADADAYATWASCHAIGDNCDNDPPALVMPSDLPNPLPYLPPTPGVIVPNPPLPPPVPQVPMPNSIPPPPT